MKDPFSYSARWDSIGLDCAYCVHENDVKWPNKDKDYACELHNISLATTLGKNGFKEGEWLCSSFKDNGKANSKAKQQLLSIAKPLRPDTLYGAYEQDGFLKELSFSDLRKNT
jgi:hypothetical protein